MNNPCANAWVNPQCGLCESSASAVAAFDAFRPSKQAPKTHCSLYALEPFECITVAMQRRLNVHSIGYAVMAHGAHRCTLHNRFSTRKAPG